MLFRCWEAWDISAGMFTCRTQGMFLMFLTFTRGTLRMALAAQLAGGADVPWWNAFSILIFLCWFGAAGYLLTRYGNFVGGVVLVLAAICGIAGGAIIFLFLTKVLLPHERELTADETDVVGAVGRVSSAIRAGGTGEIVYQQMGAVRSAFARSDDGEPIPKQEEVYVIRYEKGVAYVRRWDDQGANDAFAVRNDSLARDGTTSSQESQTSNR